jgi:hypothetical protein
MIASGMVAYVAGSWVTSRIVAALVEAEHPVSLPVEWLIMRIWLLAVLPLLAWPMGRFGIGEPFTFGLVAPMSAEVFDIFRITANEGLDGVFPSTADTVARAVTLLAGLALNTGIALWGAKAADRSAAAAQALAEAQARAHAEKLGGVAPPPSPHADPLGVGTADPAPTSSDEKPSGLPPGGSLDQPSASTQQPASAGTPDEASAPTSPEAAGEDGKSPSPGGQGGGTG